jgi:surfactin synthase thioesterase subunit
MSFRMFGPATGGQPLVCFPHAGGAASFFAPYARPLQPQLELMAAQYPGRQDRFAEPCVESIATLADIISDDLKNRLDRPAVLFGHSMGAVLAFEVACRLETAALVVSGRRAPSVAPREPVLWDDDEWLRNELRTLGGTDPSVLQHPELAELVLPVLRSDAKALALHQPDPDAMTTAPITAFVGDDDPTTTIEDAMAWRTHTSGTFTLRTFPGDHFYLQGAPAAVVAALTEAAGQPAR